MILRLETPDKIVITHDEIVVNYGIQSNVTNMYDSNFIDYRSTINSVEIRKNELSGGSICEQTRFVHCIVCCEQINYF